MSIAEKLVHAEESALDLPGLEPSSSEWKALPRYFCYCFEYYISVFHLIMHPLFSLSDLVLSKHEAYQLFGKQNSRSVVSSRYFPNKVHLNLWLKFGINYDPCLELSGHLCYVVFMGRMHTV